MCKKTCSILLLFISNPAWPCGPFDYELVKWNAASLRGNTPTEPQALLTWAFSVADDATSIYADVPFYSRDGLAWSISPGDSELSQQNTLLEIYGYFSALLAPEAGNQTPVERAATQLWLRETLLTESAKRAFAGVYVPELMLAGVDLSIARAGALDRAVNQVFGEEGRAIFARMKEQNSNPSVYGMRYFARPSFASSVHTPGISAACMAIAYGQDYFTSPDPSLLHSPELQTTFSTAFRATLVDLAAAEAFKQADSRTGALQTLSFWPAKGIECRLEPSLTDRLRSIEGRCGSSLDSKVAVEFHQSHPVVRGRRVDQHRLVQVGTSLYQVSCRDSAGLWIPISDDHGGFSELRELIVDFYRAGEARKGTSDPLLKEIGASLAVLGNLPSADFERDRVIVSAGAAACYRLFVVP